MNIIDLQDNLKNLPENALMKEMQQPTGSAPPFLILGELKRRKQMRDDYNRQQNSDMKTVAEETVTAAGMPQEGIMQASRALTPKTNMAQNTGIAQAMPVQPTQAPQMMSGGGIMRFAPGGKTPSSKPIAFVGGLPFYVSGDGKSIVDEGGNRVTENSILNSIAQSMISQSEARGSESPTGGFDSPQGIASVSADAFDFVPGGVFDATQSYSSAPQMDVREPLVSEIGSQNNRFTTNLQGVFQPRFPGDTPQQQAMVAANQGDESGIVLESGPLIQESDGGEYGPAALARRRAEQERRNGERERLAAQSEMPEDLIYGGYIPTNIGPTELNTPAMRNALSTDSGAGLATGIRYAAEARQGNDRRSEPERARAGEFLFTDATGVSRDGRTNEEILAQAQAAMAMFGQEGRDEVVADELAAKEAAAAALQATPSGSDGSINFSDLERANLALDASEDGRIQELLSAPQTDADVIKPGLFSDTGVPRTQQPRINTLDELLSAPQTDAGGDSGSFMGVFDALKNANVATGQLFDPETGKFIGSADRPPASDGFSPMATAEQKPFTQKQEVINELISKGYSDDASLYNRGMVGQKESVSKLGDGELRAIAGDPNSSLYGVSLEEMGRRGLSFGEEPIIAAQAKSSEAASRLFDAKEQLRAATTLAAKREAQAAIDAAQVAATEAASAQATTPMGILGTSVDDATTVPTGANLIDQAETTTAQENAVRRAADSMSGTGITSIGGSGGAGTTTGTTPVASTTKDTGGAGFGSMDSRIAQMLSSRQKEAESDKWMALAQTGMALMASKNPTFGGALGEAGLAGVGALQKSKQGARAFETDMLKLQTQLDIAQQRARSSGLKGGSLTLNQMLTNGLNLLKEGNDMLANAQGNADVAGKAQALIEQGQKLIGIAGGGGAGSGAGEFNLSSAKVE